MTYYIEKITETPAEEGEDDPTWDANDWCYTVMDGDDSIICICADENEAKHIAALLNERPYATTVAG